MRIWTNWRTIYLRYEEAMSKQNILIFRLLTVEILNLVENPFFFSKGIVEKCCPAQACALFIFLLSISKEFLAVFFSVCILHLKFMSCLTWKSMDDWRTGRMTAKSRKQNQINLRGEMGFILIVHCHSTVWPFTLSWHASTDINWERGSE